MSNLEAIRVYKAQTKARSNGRIANLMIGSNDDITSVFYCDPKGKGWEVAGRILDPLSFAELESKHID